MSLLKGLSLCHCREVCLCVIAESYVFVTLRLCTGIPSLDLSVSQRGGRGQLRRVSRSKLCQFCAGEWRAGFMTNKGQASCISIILQLCLRCYVSTVSELYCAYRASAYFIFTLLFGHFGRKVDD